MAKISLKVIFNQSIYQSFCLSSIHRSIILSSIHPSAFTFLHNFIFFIKTFIYWHFVHYFSIGCCFNFRLTAILNVFNLFTWIIWHRWMSLYSIIWLEGQIKGLKNTSENRLMKNGLPKYKLNSVRFFFFLIIEKNKFSKIMGYNVKKCFSLTCLALKYLIR